jgi:hypothetical protein
MAKAKFTREEILPVLEAFSAQTNKEFDTYAFATGWYESMILSLMAEVPRHKQAEIIQSLQERTAKGRTVIV